MVAGAERSAEGPTTSWLVDTTILVKLDHYHGEKEKFRLWKWKLYVALRSLDIEMAVMMKHVENNLTVDFNLERFSDDEKKKAYEAYTILALLCKEDAADLVANTEKGNGFMAWRNLCREKELQNDSTDGEGPQGRDVMNDFLSAAKGTSDAEDEDKKGNAQSMTVQQHAKRGKDDGNAQSMAVPQHASPEDEDGNAQSMTVPQHAQRSSAVEKDMEIERLETESEEEEMLEAESAEGSLSISRSGRNFLNNRAEFWPRGASSSGNYRGQEKCLINECGKSADLRIACRSEHCLGGYWRYNCRPHTQGWTCEICSDGGRSETASVREEGGEEEFEVIDDYDAPPPPVPYPGACNYIYDWKHGQEDTEDNADPESVPLTNSDEELDVESTNDDKEKSEVNDGTEEENNWSIDGSKHEAGQCKPCGWHHKPGGCSKGKPCEFCHLCGVHALKSKKKARIQRCKLVRRALKTEQEVEELHSPRPFD